MTQNFRLEGIYNGQIHHNLGSRFNGEIKLEDDLTFGGAIVDHGERNVNQFVEGHLRIEDGFVKAWFVKRPPRDRDSNLAFYLQRESDGSFEGKYSSMVCSLYKSRIFKRLWLVYCKSQPCNVWNKSLGSNELA